jgi:hypothetical protein
MSIPQLLSEVCYEKQTAASISFRPPDASTSYSPTLQLPTTIFSDSERAIQNVKSEGVTARNKHFDIRLFKSKELQKLGIVDFTFVQSGDNAADGLTKALVNVRHAAFLNMLGLTPRDI